MQVDLSDKVVLVTGASRGIGKAVARRAGAAGAVLALHYVERREAAQEVANELRSARIFQADLALVEDCERLVDDVVEALGRIDVLVNNAGVAVPLDQEASLEDWRRVWETTIAVNLRAPEVLMRLVIRHYLDQAGPPGHLRIINIASRAAFRGDLPEYTAYAASKGGLVALTRTIARGYGKRGVRAFTIAPGFTRTDMVRKFTEQYGEVVLEDVALERVTEPDDVAPLVVFLAGGLADHATGCTIDVNAGSYVH